MKARKLEELELMETSNPRFLSHFVQGKISLTPMETILIILGELEYLKVLSN